MVGIPLGILLESKCAGKACVDSLVTQVIPRSLSFSNEELTRNTPLSLTRSE